jgi:hypothetical protein
MSDSPSFLDTQVNPNKIVKITADDVTVTIHSSKIKKYPQSALYKLISMYDYVTDIGVITKCDPYIELIIDINGTSLTAITDVLRGYPLSYWEMNQLELVKIKKDAKKLIFPNIVKQVDEYISKSEISSQTYMGYLVTGIEFITYVVTETALFKKFFNFDSEIINKTKSEFIKKILTDDDINKLLKQIAEVYHWKAKKSPIFELGILLLSELSVKYITQTMNISKKSKSDKIDEKITDEMFEMKEKLDKMPSISTYKNPTHTLKSEKTIFRDSDLPDLDESDEYDNDEIHMSMHEHLSSSKKDESDTKKCGKTEEDDKMPIDSEELIKTIETSGPTLETINVDLETLYSTDPKNMTYLKDGLKAMEELLGISGGDDLGSDIDPKTLKPYDGEKE